MTPNELEAISKIAPFAIFGDGTGNYNVYVVDRTYELTDVFKPQKRFEHQLAPTAKNLTQQYIKKDKNIAVFIQEEAGPKEPEVANVLMALEGYSQDQKLQLLAKTLSIVKAMQ